MFSAVAVLCAILLLIIGNGSSSNNSDETASLDYEENLELRLRNIVSELCNCDKVKIMITTENENTSSGFSNKNPTPKIKGAAVICDKSLSDEMEKNIMSVVSKTLGIGSNHIFVGSSHIMK